MRLLAGLMLLAAIATDAHAAVLCARPSRQGTFDGAVKVRQACKANEVQLAPADVNFCCTPSTATSTTVTTTTSTSSCPTHTSTTLGIQDCGGGGGFCLGLCANARACVPDGDGNCGCTGAELPCGIVSYLGACGGTCPSGFACALFSPTLPGGCPAPPRCGCIPAP
jgi:hypothetical protein